MSEHTPGSWMLHDMEEYTVVTEKKPGRFIALCHGARNTKRENIANTRLITALPELLKTLEHVIYTLEHEARHVDEQVAFVMEASARQARAAIKTATGAQ